MHAIEILGLEKTYNIGFWRKRPKRALHPLNLAIEDGEIFGFLGPNGAGKTTTLKMLMGLVFPSAGSARILGMDLHDPRMKAQIGFLPEQPYFYDYLTARELLRYYGQLSGVDSRQLSSKVEEVLEKVGLRDSMNVQLRKFSKGMLQRVLSSFFGGKVSALTAQLLESEELSADDLKEMRRLIKGKGG